MSNDKWNTQYEQLNQRSRWYSSQLWYVAFAYVGILGLGVDKIPNFEQPLRSLAYLMLSVFSLAVYVHVVSLKFYERRAVRGMQSMENPVVSGGGSPSYVSFGSYIRIMLLIGSYAFLLIATKDQPSFITWIAIAIVTILLGLVSLHDWRRTRPVINAIRKNMKTRNNARNG